MNPVPREQIEGSFESDQTAAGIEGLRKLWRLNPTSSTAAYILNCRDRFDAALTGSGLLKPYRLAILRSFTVDPAIPSLRAGALLHGIDLTVRTGEFNTYAQEILDPNSWLYEYKPDAAILAIQTRDISPQLWHDATSLSAEDSRAARNAVLSQLASWIKAFRERSSAHLIVHSFEKPKQPGRGILDAQLEGGQDEAIETLNAGLRELARSFPNVSVLDYDGLIARYGRFVWHDALKWSTARMPVSNGCIQHLAKEWLRFVYAMAGQLRKVLVTDLDNTLWGGLAGEEGLSGIQLGQEYPGCAYQNLQRALVDLKRRGVLLAINSKNNPEDAKRILEKHTQMLLAPTDFVATRINWNDKVQNLREIAAELNVGIDSLVFLDDNPVERERVRAELPEVEVIELPSDPMLFESALREAIVFERLSLTQEDLDRTRLYQEQSERLKLVSNVGSLEDFFRSLQQVVTMAPVQPETVSRVAQLTRKTNQFNVTTRRYTEKQIQDFASSPDWRVYSVQVEDRFGDNGIVGVVITHHTGEICEIDTFLLSCRVIGRTVESAILSSIIADATSLGFKAVTGRFIPTPKNAPSCSVFRSHGFAIDAIEGNELCYRFELGEKTIPCPDWIELRTAGQQIAAYAY